VKYTKDSDKKQDAKTTKGSRQRAEGTCLRRWTRSIASLSLRKTTVRWTSPIVKKIKAKEKAHEAKEGKKGEKAEEDKREKKIKKK
jgi:hypothetical protein